MRKVLITGGAGFIGTNFVHYWHAKYPGDRVIVLDSLTYAGTRENLTALHDDPQVRFVHGDICDDLLIDELFTTECLDTVVHFAAESHVDRSISGPDIFLKTNIIGTHVLLKAAKRAWLERKTWAGVARFHHVSTDEVYGSLAPDDLPFSESTAYAPNSPYSASKAASDHLVRAYHHTFGLPTTISNCSNNFGPFQFPEKLIPLLIRNALNGHQMPIYGDGLNIRDWLYVVDHCRGIDLILERGRVGEVYNLGGGNERTNRDVVKTLCEMLNEIVPSSDVYRAMYPNCPASHQKDVATLITPVPDRPGHDRRYAIDGSKSLRQLDFKPEQSFSTGLRKTIYWYLDNRDWCEKVAARQ